VRGPTACLGNDVTTTPLQDDDDTRPGGTTSPNDVIPASPSVVIPTAGGKRGKPLRWRRDVGLVDI
jgi:hypothetical protein